jgi:fumarate hydratase class II
VMIFNFCNSIDLLSDSCELFREYCVTGLRADEARIGEHLARSLMLVTALNPIIGYEEAASVVAAARERGTDVRTVVLERGLLSPEEADRVLDVLAMTRGGLPHRARRGRS